MNNLIKNKLSKCQQPFDLKDVDIITFDVILLQAYVYYAQQNNNTN